MPIRTRMVSEEHILPKAVTPEKISVGIGVTSRVAAYDARSGEDYNYECDGIDDNLTIQQAINDLPPTGGTIFLTEGHFYFTGQVNINKNNVTIIGVGDGTILTIPDGFDSNIDMFFVQYDVAGTGFERFIMDGNEANQTAGNQRAINYENSNIGGDARMLRVDIYNFRGTGIRIGADTVLMELCRVKNCGNDGTSPAVQYQSGKRNIMVNCSIEDNRVDGISIEPGVQGTQYMIITSNSISDNDSIGIRVEVNDNKIIGNILKNNGKHGISVTADHNTIIDNSIYASSQDTDNTYNNIEMSIDADYNYIAGNLARDGGGTNQPKYGIHINGNNNKIFGNDLHNSGRTGDYLDEGTDTVFSSNRTTTNLIVEASSIKELNTGEGIDLGGVRSIGTVNIADLNVVRNYIFSDWSAGVPIAWSVTSGSVTQQTATVLIGDYSAQVDSTSTAEGKLEHNVQFFVDQFAGSQFRLAARVYCPTSAQGYIALYDGTNFFSAAALTTGQWELVEVIDTVDPAATSITVICGVYSGSYTAYFDAVSLSFTF